jgi:hypothetical protein
MLRNRGFLKAVDDRTVDCLAWVVKAQSTQDSITREPPPVPSDDDDLDEFQKIAIG